MWYTCIYFSSYFRLVGYILKQDDTECGRQQWPELQ